MAERATGRASTARKLGSRAEPVPLMVRAHHLYPLRGPSPCPSAECDGRSVCAWCHRETGTLYKHIACARNDPFVLFVFSVSDYSLLATESTEATETLRRAGGRSRGGNGAPLMAGGDRNADAAYARRYA
jgi:hypothetical protein